MGATNMIIIMLQGDDDDELVMILYVQERDPYAAMGKLLDLISAKLTGHDRTAFDQLVYAPVSYTHLTLPTNREV